MHQPFIVRIKTAILSPHVSPFNFRVGDWEVGRALFAPLLRFGSDFELQAHLVEHWRVDEDYRVVTFKLRPDLVFHNGRSVSALDLAYSLERGRQPGSRASFRQLLADIMRIEVLDGLTVRIALGRPNRMFPSYFTRAALSVVPREELQPDDPWRWRHRPVGCGPYQVASVAEDGSYLRMERHATFFGHRAASPSSLLFVTAKGDAASDLIIDDEDDEIVHHPDFAYAASRFWSTVAIEHYSLVDRQGGQAAERARDARRLINSATPPAQLLAELPAANGAYYQPAASFVPPAIRGDLAPANSQPDFFQTHSAFLQRWGALPRMVNVVYRGYGSGSDLCKLQEALGRHLRVKGLPVEDVRVDRLDLDLPSTDMGFVLTASSFNYPDLDNLTLFFARGGDVHRASAPGLDNLRDLLDQGRATPPGELRSAVYAAALALLDFEGWIHPIAHIPERAFVRTAVLAPTSIFGTSPHPFFEDLRAPG